MIDLITVVFRDELDFLKIQAHSIDLHTKPQDICTIYVIVNDTDDVAELVDPAWWGQHKNVQIVPYSKWNYNTRVNGWENQQLCKLLGASEAASNWSMCLDAKTWFVQELELDKLFDQTGRPKVGFMNVIPVFRSSRDFVEAHYNIKMNQVLGPAGVPFMFHTATVQSMINEFDNFIDFFQTNVRYPHFVTEFHLYDGYILSTHGTYEALYNKEQQYICFNIADFDVENFEDHYENILLNSPDLLTASIHRRSYPLLSKEQLIKWQQFLFQRKLNIKAILGDKQLWHSS
jgi:hypothetical protein